MDIDPYYQRQKCKPKIAVSTEVRFMRYSREFAGFLAIFDQYVAISRKRCILDTKLLYDANRKLYASYRMVSLSMPLSDPWPGFQASRGFVSCQRQLGFLVFTKIRSSVLY